MKTGHEIIGAPGTSDYISHWLAELMTPKDPWVQFSTTPSNWPTVGNKWINKNEIGMLEIVGDNYYGT